MSGTARPGFSRRDVLAGGLLATLFGLGRPVHAASATSVPWRNWSGGLVANPTGRFAPASEADLVAFPVRRSKPLAKAW